MQECKKKQTHWENSLSLWEAGYEYSLLYPQNRFLKNPRKDFVFSSVSCPLDHYFSIFLCWLD